MNLRFRAANKRLCVAVPLPTDTQQNDRLGQSFSAAPHSRQGSRIPIIREREFNHG
jgi:hypothetical protein